MTLFWLELMRAKCSTKRKVGALPTDVIVVLCFFCLVILGGIMFSFVALFGPGVPQTDVVYFKTF